MENIFQFWDIFNQDQDTFGLVACTFNDYKKYALLRSEKWGAYSIKFEEFMKIIRPLREFIPEIVDVPNQ
jgi:hypothetical protein